MNTASNKRAETNNGRIRRPKKESNATKIVLTKKMDAFGNVSRLIIPQVIYYIYILIIFLIYFIDFYKISKKNKLFNEKR